MNAMKGVTMTNQPLTKLIGSTLQLISKLTISALFILFKGVEDENGELLNKHLLALYNNAVTLETERKLLAEDMTMSELLKTDWFVLLPPVVQNDLVVVLTHCSPFVKDTIFVLVKAIRDLPKA